jgi:hypothetical protein
MSRLSELAALAREWIRRKMSGGRSAAGSADADEGSLPPVLNDRRQGAPPIAKEDKEDEPPYSKVQLFGRDESYYEETWQAFQASMRTVSSSNVYAYGFQHETATSGILYVTFLDWAPKVFGGDGSRSGPGPTYAYYDFPAAKFRLFQSEAEASAGSAVWDFCRVRHSAFEHQHTYRLIQTAGDYVPRKATAGGYKARNTNQGKGQAKLNRGGGARQQLAPQEIKFRKMLPDRRAAPNRGLPDRGEPNRG